MLFSYSFKILIEHYRSLGYIVNGAKILGGTYILVWESGDMHKS